MTTIEIKKHLYKINPKAKLIRVSKSGIRYFSMFMYQDGEVGRCFGVTFAIPLDDMGDAVFDEQMDAKLLARYIVNEEK